MPRNEKWRKCETCGKSVKTSSGTDGQKWYCKEHRLCINPGCATKVVKVNAMCRNCHKTKNPAKSYATGRIITKKCEFCSFANRWQEHYYLTHEDSLRCSHCARYITKEMDAHHQELRRKNVRRCEWCHSKLSAYNRGKVCNACWTSASINKRSKSRYASESRIPI